MPINPEVLHVYINSLFDQIAKKNILTHLETSRSYYSVFVLVNEDHYQVELSLCNRYAAIPKIRIMSTRSNEMFITDASDLWPSSFATQSEATEFYSRILVICETLAQEKKI